MKAKTLPLLRWIDGRMGESLKPTPCASVWKRAHGQQVEECSACAYSGAANWRLGWHRTVREGCQSRESSAELTRQRLFLGFQLGASRPATGPRQTQEICSPPSSWSAAWSGSRWACFPSAGKYLPAHLQNNCSFSGVGSSLPKSLHDLKVLCWISCAVRTWKAL